MATYEPADDETKPIIDRLLKNFHYERLGIKDVRVGCIFYVAKKNDNGDTVGPPLKLHGYPKGAVVRINNLKHRAQGLPDVEITIDKDSWEELSANEQTALLDHELEHIDSVKKDNAPAFDDINRPLLKLRLHDWTVEGFKVIAERHGGDAPEVKVAQQFALEYGQLLFGFAGPGTQMDLIPSTGKKRHRHHDN